MKEIRLAQGKVTILYGKDAGREYIVGIFASNELARERLRHLMTISTRIYWIRDFGVIVE